MTDDSTADSVAKFAALNAETSAIVYAKFPGDVLGALQAQAEASEDASLLLVLRRAQALRERGPVEALALVKKATKSQDDVELLFLSCASLASSTLVASPELADEMAATLLGLRRALGLSEQGALSLLLSMARTLLAQAVPPV